MSRPARPSLNPVDLSGLIFVALAVAWAAYLIPKALQHHDEVRRSRSVDRFSSRMRVLARREPVSGKDARLVVTPTRAAAPPVVTTKSVPADRTAARRAAIATATRRRRNVLVTLLVLNIAVLSLAAFSVIPVPYAAIPLLLLAAWLVACRVMVRSERGLGRPQLHLPKVPMPTIARRAVAEAAAEDAALAAEAASHSGRRDLLEDTAAHPPIQVTAEGEVRDPDMWDPVPVTLPTYVSKDAAPRTVRTIDLDSTGVWSSGRSEADSALAREADAAQRAERTRRDGDDQRAVGS